MAKKNEKVTLEDIELKPQVIGHIYQKKSNIGRVFLIFVVFVIVIYYINDISVFFNDLFGKKSASSIQSIASDEKKKRIIDDNDEDYYELSENLVLVINDLTITNFVFDNNNLSFDIYNYSEKDIDLSGKKYFLETYDAKKELIDSKEIEFNNIAQKNISNINIELSNNFIYLRIIEK